MARLYTRYLVPLAYRAVVPLELDRFRIGVVSA